MSPAKQSDANRRITALAADRAVHRAFRWLHLHEPQLRRWQLEFLRIPAPPFAEGTRAQWFCERFAELGLHRPHIDAEGNALAELRVTDSSPALSATSGVKHPADAPIILLSAHLDTVFPAGTDCTPREEGPLIHGPGASDNGAGLAALLGIAAALTHAKLAPSCTILFAANVGEEGPGDLRGMRHLFQRGPYAGRICAAVALEGSGNATVVDRALGSRRLRVTVRGPGGHSWADAGRPNPIVALATALVALAKLKLLSNPRTTLNCGILHGGTSVNSIPESATADLDLRSTSALELDRTELTVLRTLEASGLGAPCPSPLGTWEGISLGWHVARIGDRAAGALAANSALFTSLRAVDRHLSLATDARIGSTDANLPLSLGIPALAIGAGGMGSGIHTLLESFDPTGRDVALRRILLLLLDTCNLAADADA
jgi:acetylornithine deacetylase/succinyl-diaminopimelate desuccinylase-like protein